MNQPCILTLTRCNLPPSSILLPPSSFLQWGLRDTAVVSKLAALHGLAMVDGSPVAMPANNFMLVFRKQVDDYEEKG